MLYDSLQRSESGANLIERLEDMWPFKRKHRDIPETGVEQSWTMFQSEWGGQPLIARVNFGLRAYVGHPSYSHQVGLAVPFRSPDENGFPRPEETSELTDIEDKICSELEVGNESLFAAVITTNGMREFVFYTANPQNVEVKLKNLKNAIQSHAIQGMIRPDRDWQVYRRFD